MSEKISCKICKWQCDSRYNVVCGECYKKLEDELYDLKLKMGELNKRR